MKRVGLTLALLCSATAASAAPGDMSVAAFLGKVDALKAKGMAAMFSSDIGLLKSEAMAAGAAYRERLKAERAQGRPSSCPPAAAKVNSNQFIGHLQTYPAAQRPAISLKQAIADMFTKTWPCR